MSWAFAIPPTAVADFQDAAHKALEDNREYINLHNPDGLAAASEAVDAAADMVAAGTVGEGVVSCLVSGHGNPDHIATPGQAKDCVSISISRYDA